MSCKTGLSYGLNEVLNYPDQDKPGDLPKIFAPGIVSIDNKNTHACIFSPDGKMLVFSRYPDKKSYIMILENNTWSDPVEAFFKGKECSFSSDGKRIFYYENKGDIFYNEKKEDGWGYPVNAGFNINTDEIEFYPSVTNDETLFFSRNSNWNDSRILYSTLENGRYSAPVDVSLWINKGGALHAYVAKDKSYILFNSSRKGSYTQLDIWISFRNNDNTWTKPKNLGKEINSGADAILCPTVSPDGKYLFFTKLDFSSNTGYVYWVSTTIIDVLRLDIMTDY